ncbi:hypothetical protein N5I27_14520 [Acinetobacter johnsonii]|uniref:Spore coat protein U domain-containing protein n=1 Tax=Acinetobacter johnsonii TaxID=40214 RepID=A0AA42U8L1_ACIJO|nr:hypothetical protein [Acinetobacter johnsonii]MDH1439522.1 hypothetical protein [Acinetobacter johnsonii]
MNNLLKMSLMAVTLGLGSTAVFATEERPAPDPDECNEGPCKGYIPIHVTVPKRCAVKVPKTPIILKDGETETASFQVGANANYRLVVDTANRIGAGATVESEAKNGGNAVGIEVRTRKAGSPTVIQLNDPQVNTAPGPGGWNTYNVEVKSDYVGMSKPAGTYSDNYSITVSF